MGALFASGHAADIVLGVLAIEAVILARRGWAFTAILGLIGPAALIVLGLRAALVGAEWYWVSLPVALAFPLHLLDLRHRLRTTR
ncbi:hypothetical protein I5L01_13105 [Erythrobacter sp. YJ-T3-07]|nr:hypothetical protein [Erythrobacter sp. YJ-T3-07]